MIRLSKIFYWGHIFKARIIVAYALFYELDECSAVIREEIYKTLTDGILVLILYPFVRFNMGLTAKKEFSLAKYRLLKRTYNSLYKNFFKEYTKHRKTSLANYVYVKIDCPALGSYFPRIIGIAWLCEKLNLNVKFTFPHTYLTGNTNFFENPILVYSKECQNEKFMQLKKPLVNLTYRNYEDGSSCVSLWENFAKRRIPSEYGYKILSKLSIKREMQQQADQWWHKNIKRKCIGVHYRQTDGVGEDRIILIENYIAYLKEVVDNRYDILACSDNVQFIDAMHKEFPGKVFSRDITRSNDRRSLHRHEPYAGDRQKRDALIDILTLSKTETIYTVGSSFIDIIRFFNPLIRIISLDGRAKWSYNNIIPNYLPIPKNHLVKEAQRQTAWKKSILRTKQPPNIEGRLK